MLAGIYDPRGGSDRAGTAARLRNAFGADAEARARYAGPLAVVADAAADGPDAGCALEGAIYNARELAAELGGPADAPAADLVARAYSHWGEGMLDRLRGGFALVAWDARGERILLAQDQVAIGALFLHQSGDELVFASEIHHLLRLLPRTPPPDELALVRWIGFEFLYDRITLFEGVRRLGAGRLVSLTSGRIEERQYWQPTHAPPLEGSRLEIAAQFKDALVRAVELRVRDAGSVGLTLSGGFDSSAVAAAVALVKDEDQSLHGYSAVFPDEPGMDDRDYLDVLEEALPLTNVRYTIAPGGTLAVSLLYLRDWELPLSGPGWITEWPLLRRAVSDGVEVMLDGQGGDEVFGLSPFLMADRIRQGRLLSAVGLARHGIPGSGTGAPPRRTLQLLEQYGFRAALPHPLYTALRRLRGPERHAASFLSGRAARLIAESTDQLRWARGGSEPRWWLHMRQMLIEDREAAGLGDFARHRALWVGLDGRPPLFDMDLIETALRLPPELAFDSYLNRPLAREALAGVLPDPIRLSRRKSNLAPFYHRGLTGPDLPLIREILGADRLEIDPWVKRDVLRGLLERPPPVGGEGWYAWLNAIWGTVTAECWLRQLSEPSFADEALTRASEIDYRETR